MKKFSKLFLSCAAVAAVTAAVATSAMAADKTLTASYNVDTDGKAATLTINCDSQDATKTLLVLKPNTDLANITKDDICQIEQDGTIATVKLPAYDKTNAEQKGTYTVLMGGTSGDIYKGTFTIGQSDIVRGDVNNDKSADSQDALMILEYDAGLREFTADQVTAGDVTGDHEADSADSLKILMYDAGLIDSLD